MSDTTPDGPTYPVVITTALLEQHGACDEELAAFRAACPSGELVIPDAVAHLAALSGPLAEFEERAVTAGILPPLVSTAGYGGTAIAGHRGTATAGYGGTAIAGRGGTASAGYGGLLVLRWWDEEANRCRVAVAYVGEHAPGLPDGAIIEAGVPYRVEVVEGRPMWRRAEVSRG